MVFCPPDMVRVRHRLDVAEIGDVEAELAARLDESCPIEGLRPGARVALTAGSRGIRDLVPVFATLVRHLRDGGVEPFVVPCMGSHGGATADGQRRVLASLGVTETAVGAPIVSSMDVVDAGRSRFGRPVWVSRDLAEADAVVAVNRIKLHTDFDGPFESGLVKMLVVGAGKHRGAAETHRLAIRHGFPAVLEESARIVLDRLPVICGVGIVENQIDTTAEVHVLAPHEIVPREPALLARARELMPFLPFDVFDCLLVDEMGKEVSGTGLDTNVIGRNCVLTSAPPERPRITRVVVRDLTPASRGNAIGIGMADFVTERLLTAVDREVTAVNCITSLAPEDARLPIGFERDVDAVEAAFLTSGAPSPAEFKLVWIRNTLALRELLISGALLPAADAHPQLDVLGEAFPFPVREDGTLDPGWSDDAEGRRATGRRNADAQERGGRRLHDG